MLFVCHSHLMLLQYGSTTNIKNIKPKICVYVHITYDIIAIQLHYQNQIIKPKICHSHMMLL